nr:hypothetical protein [Rhizobium leguminosarum]
MKTFAEQHEPEVRLRQMTEGHNVVEDYGHVGLTLREHPVAFSRRDLQKRNIVTLADCLLQGKAAGSRRSSPPADE